MNKSRSVRARNVCGGFLGGVLGILACGFLHPLWLPVGCFLGVVIGWWYEDILLTIGWTMRGVWPLSNMAHAIGNRLSLRKRWRICRFVAQIFLAAQAISVLLVCALCIEDPSAPVWAVTGYYMFVGVLIAAFANQDIEPATLHASYDFYLLHGFLLSLLREIWLLLQEHWQCTFFVTVMLVQYLVVMPIVAMMLLPVAACVGFIKGVYLVSRHKGHWPCFIVTLTVTTMCAIAVHPHMSDPLMLWLSALAAGCLSGGLTEALRPLLARFTRIRCVRIVALTSLKKIFEPLRMCSKTTNRWFNLREA